MQLAKIGVCSDKSGLRVLREAAYANGEVLKTCLYGIAM